MKLRVGLIAPHNEDAVQLKKQYPDLYTSYAKNVLEFYQTHGSQKYDALLFLDSPLLKNEITNYLNFLRQKKDFNKTPIALLTQQKFEAQKIISDPLVRNFSSNGDYFLSLLNFFDSIQREGAFLQLISEEKIEQQFSTALTKRFGQATEFISRPANQDEAHESFFCQKSDEIATNLLWLKFSARILEKGSDQVKKMFTEEADVVQYLEKLLAMAFDEFSKELQQTLSESGAISFPKSEALPGIDKVPFIKSSKSFVHIFESSMCTILLETIRYI